MHLHSITKSKVALIELVTLGLGSKRGDETKIGHKGSGMKFAIAALHRHGSRLRVEVDGRTWTTTAAEVTVRGVTHTIINLVADNGEVMPANIALTAGEDTWGAPWFALRELLQNTLDEGGTCYASDEAHRQDVGDGTAMSIELTPALASAWEGRADWFHARHPEIIYNMPSGTEKGGLFYHGFRISTEPEWTRCYDVTTILARENLSEDRQARGIDVSAMFTGIMMKGEFCPSLYAAFVNYTQRGANNDIGHLLQAIYAPIYAATPDIGGFSMARLEEAFYSRYGSHVCTTTEQPSDRDEYYAEAEGIKIIRISYRLDQVLQYSSKIKRVEALIPSLSQRLTAVKPDAIGMDTKERLKRAVSITRGLRPLGCKVDVVDTLHKDDASHATAAMADIEGNRVMLMRSWCEQSSVNELVCGLVEEYCHINSRCGDGSTGFEKELIRVIAAQLMPKEKAVKKEEAFSL
jgi:hypothetical protein